MEKSIFQLRPNDEFIELNKLLQIQGLAQTGGHAKIIIENEEVKVNGEVELRKRRKLRSDDVVEVNELRIEITK